MHIGDWTFSKEVRLDSLRVRVSKNLQSSDLTHHWEPMIISHFYKMKLTKSLQEFQSLGQSMYTLVTYRLQDHIILSYSLCIPIPSSFSHFHHQPSPPPLETSAPPHGMQTPCSASDPTGEIPVSWRGVSDL